MKKNSLTILFLLYHFTTLPLFALELGFAKGDGGRPGGFLEYGAGARSLGMGKTFTAIADDASAVYWNPAGLAQLRRKELVALHNKLYVDTDYSFLSLAIPLGSRCKGVGDRQEEQQGVKVYMGVMGIALVNLNSTGFQLRDEYNYEQGEGGANESAAIVSYGRTILDGSCKVNAGISLKVVKQNIDTKTDTGFGADLGLLTNYKRLRLGVNVQNLIAPRLKLKNKEDVYPLSATLGLGYRVLQDKLLIAMDIRKTENRSLKLHAGSEYIIANLFAIRAGIDETEAAMGAGIQWRNYAIDYAFAYHDAWKGYEDLGASHRFGLTVKWGNVKTVDNLISGRGDKEKQEELVGVIPQAMVDAQKTALMPEERVKQEIEEQIEKQTREKVTNVEIEKMESASLSTCQPVNGSTVSVYVVKEGDCLWTIAAKQEIDHNPWNWILIYEANKEQINNPNLIYPGQTLKIPRKLSK